MYRAHLNCILRIGFGLLTLIALGRQLAIQMSLSLDVGNFFSYYTILSNLFAGCVLLISAWPSAVPERWVGSLRFISTVNMALVGIVFSILLRNIDLGPLLPWVNLVHHYVMPVVVVSDWVASPPGFPLSWRHLLISLAFPLGYLIFSLARGQITGWYPYPFLDAKIIGSAAGVAVYVVAITAVFCLVGWALMAVGNWRAPRRA